MFESFFQVYLPVHLTHLPRVRAGVALYLECAQTG